jgi:hypothetical protein
MTNSRWAMSISQKNRKLYQMAATENFVKIFHRVGAVEFDVLLKS